jgi:death-on-curing protein
VIVLLSLDDLLRIHDAVIRDTGGSTGIREPNLLDSARVQPDMSFGGVDLYPTISSKAGALAFSLINNHPFVDGNKRVAYAAMETFLVLNGWEIQSDQNEQYYLFIRLASGESEREELTEWIELHISPIKL